MDDLIKDYFNVDKKFTTIVFYTPENEEIIIYVRITEFKEMFSDPLQNAVNNGTDPMEEIRLFDPNNTRGYNNLIV